MGLTLSSDLLLDELNNIDNDSDKRMVRGLANRFLDIKSIIKNSVKFLGFWDAISNYPPLTNTVEEGSVYKVSVASDSSILGRCLCNDWILFADGQWNIIRLTLQEVGSNVLMINPPNVITVKRATISNDGYLAADDWNVFNSKQSFLGDDLIFSDSTISNGINDQRTIISSRAVRNLIANSGGGGGVILLANELWNPSTNRPELKDDAGVVGYNYYVSSTASVDLGLGLRMFTLGQIISYNKITKKWE